jgi:hypothetical protein
MSLDNNILPEIGIDEFGVSIFDIVSMKSIQSVLEIGTGSGGGSTSQIIDALMQKTNSKKTFDTIEISKTRNKTAANKYRQIEFAEFHCGCSVHPDEYSTEFDVVEFYNNKKTALNQYPLEMVLQWRRDELNYIQSHKPETQLIDKIKINRGLNAFDFVLIDGSEFTGIADLSNVFGSKYIALDDIDAYKNNINYFRLTDSREYKLVIENWNLRNGFAIFKLK